MKISNVIVNAYDELTVAEETHPVKLQTLLFHSVAI